MPKRKEATEVWFILSILDTKHKHDKDWIPFFKTSLYSGFEDELNDNSGKSGHSYQL